VGGVHSGRSFLAECVTDVTDVTDPQESYPHTRKYG
jgi:hypothetical protein